MFPPLCKTCEGEGRDSCVLIEYKERVLAMSTAAQDIAVTPSPLGGNDDLAAWVQRNTDADFAGLPEEAARRGCTVFEG